MKKRIFSFLLAAIMLVSLLPVTSLAAETGSLDNFKQAQTYTDGTFTDVKAADWFYENIVSVYGLALMVGRGGGRFAPDDLMTVAEAMTIAARLHSIYYTGKAEFAKSELWYQVYTDYCKANGIADPANYDLNKPITRGQFADMFANAFPASALKKINTVQDNMIPDVKTTDKFGAAIYLLYRAGVLVGNDAKGTFAPNSNIRRMEVAAITTRMADTSLRQSIRLVKQSSGGGSYTPPAPETPLTIADILPADFPTSADGFAPENAWVTDENAKAFIYNGMLIFRKGTPDGFALTSELVKNGNNYEFTDTLQGLNLLFVMSDGVLSAITLSNSTQNSGTYMKMITIADVLATVEGGFPSSSNALTPPENAWTAGDGQSVHFYTDKSTLVFNEPGGTTNGMSASNGVTRSGSDYEYSTSEVTTTFHMTGGKLTSIEYYHDKNHKFDGTYIKMNTIADVLATVEGGFPSSSDEYPPFESAWTTGGYYQYVYFCTDNATLVFTEATLTTIDVSISNGITKSGSDYKYSENGVSITFHMTGGKLTSIELAGNPLFAGTYASQKTVADMLATVEGGFPSSSIPSTPPAGAWTDGQGKTIYANTEGTTVYFKNDLGQSTSMSTTALLIVSGSDYVYGTAYVTITFHMTQGKLTSIQYSASGAGDFSGTYTAPAPMTIGGVLATVEDGFPTAEENAWVNGDIKCWKDPGDPGEQLEPAIVFGPLEGMTYAYKVTKNVTKDGNNWKYTNSSGATTLTFNMEGNVLKSINYYSTDSGKAALNGTYAPAAPTRYTVTFNMNGHGDPISSITNVTSGATIEKPTDPTAKGYVFKGWFKEEACENEWNFESDTVTKDTTLYAKWSQTFSIIYWLSSSPKFSTAPTSACEGEEVTIVPNTGITDFCIYKSSDKGTITGTLNGAVMTFNYRTVSAGDVIKFIMPAGDVIVEPG